MNSDSYLIVNADDMGLHEKINEGIIEGHKSGCISSTTLMAGAPAFGQAVELLRQHPALGVGIHLTLVADRPVCTPEQVPSLVDSSGFFRSDYGVFLKRYIQNKIDLSEVSLELEAQIKKVFSQNLPITHVDSHQHLHIVPGISKIVIKLCHKYGIQAVRYPKESLMFRGGFPASFGRIVGRTGLSMLADWAKGSFHKAQLFTPDHFFGMLAGGNMKVEYFHTILENLPSGVSEIMIHPGSNNEILGQVFNWQYHWEEELKSACWGRTYLKDKRIRLIHYGDLIRLRGGKK